MLELWIDGGWQASSGGGTAPIINPATLELVEDVTEGTPGDVARATEAASRAWHHWRRMPAIERGKLLHEAAALMRADRARLSTLLTLEGGKPRIENLDEVEWCAACFQYYAEIARNAHGSSIPPTAEHQLNFTIKEPLGVVAAIVPFNYPLLLLVWKIAPALAAGNTVVVKPSELTPLATLRMVEHALAHLPPGVVNVVTGGPAVGAALVDDPRVACVAFTGSTAVGTRIAEHCARHLKRVNLELGGIDPLIVFEDANLDVAVPGAAWARFLNNGQVCTSAKRIYVVDAVADPFVERFVQLARQVRVGDPRRPETDMGPLISSRALGAVKQSIENATREGARLATGGGRPEGCERGHFLEPTVLDRVRHGGCATREEVFGPVAAIVRVRDVEEAIALANDSEYGLGANIYTNNLRYVMTAMEEIKAGTFWVNDPLTDNEAGPFGGMRQSGIGRELGEEGLDAFRETKHVHIDYIQERKSYWFPYAARQW